MEKNHRQVNCFTNYMEKLPGAQGPYKEPAAMACLPSLAFVAFAACFEAPSSSSLRSPPSIASGASCHPFPCSPPVDLSLELCGSRFGAAFRILGFVCSTSSLPGLLFRCNLVVSTFLCFSKFCRFGMVYVEVCAWGKSVHDFLCSCTSERA